MATLTKAELKLEIARAAAIPQKEAKGLLEIILDSMVRALRKGERIEVRGFGTIGTHVRRARVARNPRTGKTVKVRAKRVPHFKPSKQLRSLINGNGGRKTVSPEAAVMPVGAAQEQWRT